MTCYHPMIAIKSSGVHAKTGKPFYSFVGSVEENPRLYQKSKFDENLIVVPCGQCIGCRLERSRQWAIRISHEASLYEHNCFITLTYMDKYCPSSLDVREFQLFMKRLRKKFGNGIRFFHCGEYGDLNQRPHYHACLLNFDFPDKKLYYVSNGYNYYLSESLSELWPYGIHLISDLTFDSAGYVARYVLKKLTGDASAAYGERKSPYVTMSRRPGIGRAWIDKYLEQTYSHDFLVVNGHKCLPPKFYDRILQESHPHWFDFIKEQRSSRFSDSVDATIDRLNVREECIERKISNFLPRPLDSVL